MSVGSSGAQSLPRLLRKGAIAAAVGLAEREGYLARVPEIGQLGAIGSVGAIAWGLRRFGRVNLPILDDVAEIAVIVMGLKLGREGLGGGASGTARVSGTDIGSEDIGAESDPFEVQGDDDDY